MINTESKDSFIGPTSDEALTKATVKGRSRPTSPEQRVSYLRSWEASGLSAEAFAASRPINAQSLYRWRMLEKSGKINKAKPAAPPFAEIKFPRAGRGQTDRISSIVLKSARLEATIQGCELSRLLPDILEAMGKDRFDV